MRMEQTLKNREVTEIENCRKAIVDMTTKIHEKKLLRRIYRLVMYLYTHEV